MNAWTSSSPCTVSTCVSRAGDRPHARRTLRRTAAFARVVTRAVASGERIAGPETLRASARSALDALGVRLETDAARLGVRAAPPAPGAPAPGTLVVANHISWLDVVALLAVEPVTMLAKREIAAWPVVGPVVRRAGTRFIDRDSLRSLPGTVAELAALLRTGRSVMVFPEGVTWCSGTGGRFRRAVFEAALDAGAPVRPVTIGYRQHGRPSTVAAFVGEDDFAASLRRLLAADGLTVHIRAHAPVLPVPGVDDRRSLAERAQRAVRTGDALAAVPWPVRAGDAVAAAHRPEREQRPRPAPRERAG